MALSPEQQAFLMGALHVPPAPRGQPDGSPAGPLAAAPQTWIGMRSQLEQRIGSLKAAVLEHFAEDGQALLAEIGKTMTQLDGITSQLDHSLAARLADAHAASDPAARNAAVEQCKALLARHRAYVDAEPLIAHIDANPLGIPTGIRTLLDGAFDSIEQSLSHS